MDLPVGATFPRAHGSATLWLQRVQESEATAVPTVIWLHFFSLSLSFFFSTLSPCSASLATSCGRRLPPCHSTSDSCLFPTCRCAQSEAHADASRYAVCVLFELWVVSITSSNFGLFRPRWICGRRMYARRVPLLHPLELNYRVYVALSRVFSPKVSSQAEPLALQPGSHHQDPNSRGRCLVEGRLSLELFLVG